MKVRVCVCVCVWGEGKEGGGTRRRTGEEWGEGRGEEWGEGRGEEREKEVGPYMWSF